MCCQNSSHSTRLQKINLVSGTKVIVGRFFGVDSKPGCILLPADLWRKMMNPRPDVHLISDWIVVLFSIITSHHRASIKSFVWSVWVILTEGFDARCVILAVYSSWVLNCIFRMGDTVTRSIVFMVHGSSSLTRLFGYFNRFLYIII